MTGLFTRTPTLIAHRGFGKGVVGGHRENTLAAFQAAVEHGVEWVEVDVRRSRDDRLCVLHNPTTDSGAFLVDQEYDEAGAGDVLALDALLEALPPSITVNLDVKSSLEDALLPWQRTTAGLLAPVLQREAARRRLLVTSFDPSVLLITRAVVPAVPLGLLAWLYFPLRKAIPAAVHLGLQVVAAHWESFGPNPVDPAPVHRPAEHSVRVAHQAGLEVVAWCPPPEPAMRLVDAGVDAIVVNDVVAATAALGTASAG